MSSKTTNLNLHKIDLTDAPPDITVLNQNWDILDAEIQEIEDGYLPLTGGVLSGALTIKDNLNVNKSFEGVEYKTYVRPINYSIENDGNYTTGLIHYQGTVNNAQLMFNKGGVMLRDNVNGKAYHLFGQHNTDKLKTVIESLGVAKIQTGSYVGTGTNEEAGACSLTFDFIPKLVVFHVKFNGSYTIPFALMMPAALTSAYTKFAFSTLDGNDKENANYAKIVGTTVSWYTTTSPSGFNGDPQMNKEGYTYYWVAIG